MEIFISGSQVCEKENKSGSGPFQMFVCMSHALLVEKGQGWSLPGEGLSGRRKSESQPRVRRFPLNCICRICGYILCLGQTILEDPDPAAWGHLWDPPRPNPHPTWDPHLISFNILLSP